MLTEDGAFTWTPQESYGGTSVLLTVRVSDLGSPEYTDSTDFRIIVREVLNPPDMPLIPAQFVDEGHWFRLRIEAADPDTPPSPVVFTLESGPTGASIDRTRGDLAWFPGEEVGPTNAIFVVRATELNPPYASSARTFSVTVNEVNQSPVLLPLADQVVGEGQTLAIQAQAVDADLPAQGLSFSIAAGAPPRDVRRSRQRLDRVVGGNRRRCHHEHGNRARY